LFLARYTIHCRARYICYRPSICLSVLPSHGWISQNGWLCNFHGTLLFCGISFIQKFWRVPMSGGVKQKWGGETSCFLALCVSISKTVRDTY